MNNPLNYIFNTTYPTACYQITNEDCININKARQEAKTVRETIEVGLELPNANNPTKLVRFVPRYITIITKS